VRKCHSRCHVILRSFFCSPAPPPTPALFPYTTLFRSDSQLLHDAKEVCAAGHGAAVDVRGPEHRLAPVDEKALRFMRDNAVGARSEEHTSELQSLTNLVCRLLLEKKTPLDSRNSAPPT